MRLPIRDDHGRLTRMPVVIGTSTWLVYVGFVAAVSFTLWYLQPTDYPTLSEAVEAGDIADIKRYLRRGADVNRAFGQQCETALHWAIRIGYPEIIPPLREGRRLTNVYTPIDGSSEAH